MAPQDNPKQPPSRESKDTTDPIETRLREVSSDVAKLSSTIVESSRSVRDLGRSLENVLSHLGNLQEDHDVVKTGLWEKTGALEEHCAKIQDSHDAIKQTVWSNSEKIARLEELWADTQRDLTTLAEAISRLSGD